MNRETIKKAADEFAEREYEINNDDRDYLHKGFYHGAQWRINSVWHEMSEKPNGMFAILVDLSDDDGEAYSLEMNLSGVESSGKRWAYVSDLLPDRKEE